MIERSAWFCPACQKHHAPHVETCPGGISRFPPIFDRLAADHAGYDPCANCKGPCGNVACPKMLKVTCISNLPINTPPPNWNTILVGQATTGGVQ